MKIKLGEKEVDLKAATPVLLGDVRRLKKDFGLALGDLSKMDADTIAQVLLVLAQKVNPAVTEEDVNSITLVQIGEVAMFLQTDGLSADRPT